MLRGSRLQVLRRNRDRSWAPPLQLRNSTRPNQLHPHAACRHGGQLAPLSQHHAAWTLLLPLQKPLRSEAPEPARARNA